MRKLILLSLVLATFVIPMFTSRSVSPVRGLRLALCGFAGWVVVYVVLLWRMHWW